MVFKYFVNCSTGTFGIMFDDDKAEVAVGGFRMLRGKIEVLISEAFKKKIPEMLTPQENKIRYKFKCSWEQLQEVFKLLDDSEYAIKETRKLGRVMI